MELIVKLKQHTPIIHFQWNQKGTTLRATELKPKLDRFLKEKNDNRIEKYFGEKGNLPYKIKIITQSRRCSIEEIEKIREDSEGRILKDRDGNPRKTVFPAFFGNVGIDVEKEKRFVFCEGIELRFTSFYSDVIETIKQSIAEFFFKTNFGMRQSKGVGSFYLDTSDLLYKAPSVYKDCYEFTLDTRESNFYQKYKKLFGDIDLFYRTLRSGINLKDRNGNTLFYFKSLMFLYAKQQNWTWDKKAIKSKFIDPSVLNKQKGMHNNSDLLTFSGSNQYLVRDLLGVATSQAYMSERFELQHDEQNEIQRFKSPITFKPVETANGQFKIYLITSPLTPDIFNKEFTIYKVIEEIVNGKKRKKQDGSVTLKTPPEVNQFDIDKYLQFALSIDIDKHVDSKFHEHEYFRVIKRIYSGLKEKAKDVRTKHP
ncbi:MAG TPA: hypothetical protein DEP99_04130 [Nitrospiraceae bacterium]|nr:hypothetical protein [Nitrospiraceae bacterium]